MFPHQALGFGTWSARYLPRLGQTAGASQWPAQNIVIAPMTIATGVAAIFINSPWVQILALAIQIVGWIWYVGALQTAVSG
jgi:hypothetical protein